MMENSEFLTFKYDDYHRKPIAENIIALIKSNMPKISPLIIDSGWGTGKTVFCQRLINLFNEPEHIDHYRLGYLNLFQTNADDEPILVILSMLLSLYDAATRETILPKLLPALKSEIKTIPFSISASGMPSSSQNQGMMDDQTMDQPKACPIEKMSDHYLRGRLNHAIDAKTNMEQFRQALTELTNQYPAVIFIDEIDRCKPNYAVRLLETIKHAFDLPSLHFVVVTHFDHLQLSVNRLYGNAVNAREYLDKFIGLQLSLPNDIKTEFHERVRNSLTHWQWCSQSIPHIQTLNNCLEYRSFIRELIYNNDLSLREVETFSQYLHLFQTLPSQPRAITKSTNRGYGLYYLLAIYLYSFERQTTRDILYHNLDIQKIQSILLPDRYQNSANQWISQLLIAGLNSSKHRLNSIEKDLEKQRELAQLFNTQANLELFEDIDFILRETIHKLQLENH